MDRYSKGKEGQKNITEITTVPVPYGLTAIKENISTASNYYSQSSQEQILKKAITFHLQGKISEARKNYQYLISQGFNDHRVFSNYGVILKDLGNFKEAELYQRKAIQINPNHSEAHYNLGTILIDIGALQEAELSTRKAIKLNPNFADAHLNLGGILRDLGKLQEAEISLHKAINLKENYDTALAELGSVFMRQGKHKEGIQKLREGNGYIIFDYCPMEATIRFFS